MKLIIPGRLPGLNEYIAAERTHKQKAAKMKRREQDAVIWCIRSCKLKKCSKGIYMRYLWVEKDKRRDKDNICAFGRKVIQDALVESKIIPNDNWEWIKGFSDEFATDNKNPRIEIEILEVEG